MTTSSAKGRGGKRYFYYRNAGAEKEPDFPFELKQVSAPKLEEKVLGLVRDLAQQPATVDAAVQEANRVLRGQLDPLREKVMALQREAARAQEEASQMTRRALLLDLGDSSMVKQELEMAGARARMASLALAAAEAELQAKEGTYIDTLVVREALRGFDDAWDNLNADERRDLLRLLIQKVVVRPGRAEVHFYGSDAVTVWMKTGRGTKKNETPLGVPEGFVSAPKWRRQQDSNL